MPVISMQTALPIDPGYSLSMPESNLMLHDQARENMHSSAEKLQRASFTTRVSSPIGDAATKPLSVSRWTS